MQSQQLLPKGEVLEEEFSSGAKDGEDPAEQMSKAHKHQGIIAKSAQRRQFPKLLILRLCRVLARHSSGSSRHLAFRGLTWRRREVDRVGDGLPTIRPQPRLSLPRTRVTGPGAISSEQPSNR